MLLGTCPKRRAPKRHEIWRYRDLQISHQGPIGDQNDQSTKARNVYICHHGVITYQIFSLLHHLNRQVGQKRNTNLTFHNWPLNDNHSQSSRQLRWEHPGGEDTTSCAHWKSIYSVKQLSRIRSRLIPQILYRELVCNSAHLQFGSLPLQQTNEFGTWENWFKLPPWQFRTPPRLTT